MPAPETPRRFRYGAAIAASCLGIGLKLLLGPVIVPSAFLTSYPAVIFSAWYGGLGPGLAATAVSVAVGSYLFLPTGPTSEVREVLFVGIAALLSIATATLTARQRRITSERTRELEEVNATLRDSEERFHQAFESAATGMALMTLKGLIVQANHAMCEILLYERHELLGRIADDIVHPDDRLLSHQDREHLLRGEIRSYQTERRLLRKDGRTVWAQVSVSLLRDAQGRPRYVISQVQDVTRRKRAEEELRRSEERFALAVAGARDAIWDWDLTANQLYVSPHWSRILGLEVRERTFAAQDWLDRVHTDDRETVVESLRAHLEGRTPFFENEHRLRQEDGQYVWVSSRGLCVRDASGKPYRVAGSVADISGRKQTEAVLRESEAKFRTLAETVAAAIFIYKGTQLCYVNPQAEAITGYSREELLGMPFWEIIHPEFRDLVRQRGLARQRGDEVDSRYEVTIRRKDGSSRWVDFTGARFDFEGGQAVLGTAFDITERKLVQQAVREREADLAHMLRLTTMNEMAAGLAHEINQPLSAIVNYAKGCVRRLDTQEYRDGDVRDAIDRIGEEALRAGEVIRRLRHLVRKEPPRREVADLNSLVQEALRFVDGDVRDLAVRVDVELSALPVRVLADAVQIEQVILNLIRNGLDAIREAGGERRTLSIRTRRVDGIAEVEVRDTGRGLPEPNRERIFEPFFTTKSEGLGMGLSISRSIVETHGGRLMAVANEGGGACVSFTLPVEEGALSYVQ